MLFSWRRRCAGDSEKDELEGIVTLAILELLAMTRGNSESNREDVRLILLSRRPPRSTP